MFGKGRGRGGTRTKMYTTASTGRRHISVFEPKNFSQIG
jgi:hypothetical protein